MGDIRRVTFCPHCGNKAPQKLIHSQYFEDTGWDTKEGTPIDDIPGSYFVAVCETCNQILLYGKFGEYPEDESIEFRGADLLWPDQSKLHKSVPKVVADIYDEAIRIKSHAPNAFAVQIRRSLEAICEDKGAKQGSLQKRLKDLANKGEIPPVLAETTDVLRILGNLGAHAANQSVKPWQVFTIDSFFRTFIEYVYVAPSKLAEFRASLKDFHSKLEAEDQA